MESIQLTVVVGKSVYKRWQIPSDQKILTFQLRKKSTNLFFDEDPSTEPDISFLRNIHCA